MKNISRYLTVALCFVLLFVVTSRPMQVSANTAVAEFVNIGYALNDVAQVAPVLVPFALALIAGGFVFNNTDELINKAQELSDKMKPTTIEWAQKFASGIKAGTQTAVQFTTSVIKDLNAGMAELWEYAIAIPATLSYLVVPQVLTNLQTLSLTDIIVQDISVLLAENNTLSITSNNILTSIKEGIIALPNTITEAVSNVGVSFSNQMSQVKDWLYDVNENLKVEVHQIPNWLSSINTNVKSDLSQVKDWLKGIKTGIVDGFAKLREDIVALPNTISTAITNALAGSSSGDDNANEDFDGTVSGGVNQGIGFFGQSNGILADHASAFLVAKLIFNQFADIPLVNQLLIVALSIGLVGAFLGIAINISSKESYSGRKAKAGGN